ncbi:MAG: elongation factor G [Rhodobacteraceae bacterium]|nr:elongation factor G [Paracoccaceae bacterium]
MTRCIAVIGPSAAGKSELIDQMAMLEGKRPPAAPPVDLRCAEFSYLGEDWVALDCPGSLEFVQTALDAILCADAVVIVASPDPDQAVLAAPWIRLAETGNVPRFLFVNRIDECRHDARGIMSAIQSYSERPIILRQVPIRDGERIVGAVDLVSDRAWRYRDGQPSELIEVPDDLRDRQAEGREELLESLSEHDDWLLEEIIEDRTPATGAVYGICARTLAENLAVPAFFGSAATGNGIRRLMKALRHEAPQPGDTRSRLNDAVASAFMSRTRKHVGKLVWLRSFADELSSGATVGGNSIGGLVDPFGERPVAKTSIDAGGVASAVKSDHLSAGCLYSETGQIESPEWYKAYPALWNRTISALNDRDDAKLSEALHKIAAEDLSLTVIHDQESGQVILGTQGSQHLRRIQQTLSDVFGVETDAGPFVAHYRETITQTFDIHFRHKKQSGGAGQFADVKLTVGPAKRGDGFAFSETIHGGSVPRNYIPAVQLGAEEAMARGPLGFPVIDVLVNLYDGQHHSVDSSDMAFRIAGRGGVSEGLSKAQPVLLEPIFEVRFRAPSVFTGALNPMISSMRGQILGFDREADAEGWDVVRALMPGTSLEGLINNLRSATQGVGRYEADFAHFQELYGREADEIVERRAEENARR